MKQILTTVFLLSSLFLSTPSENKIPLQQAVADGIKLSFAYQNNLLNEENAELYRIQVEKIKKFRVDFSSSYLFKSDTMIIETPAVQIPNLGTINGQRIEAGLRHNFDLNLALTQPLFTGGILSNRIKLEEIKKAIEANQSELTRNRVASDIKTSFFNLRLLRQKKQILATLMHTLEIHQRRQNELYKEGLLKRTDILETLAKIEEAGLSLEDLQHAITIEEIYFTTLTGHKSDEIEPDYSEKAETHASAMMYLKSHHPVLKTLQQQSSMLQLQKKIAGGRYLPQINGFAELHYGKPGIDYFAQKWSVYFQGGISLKIPVFDWKKLNIEKTILDNKLNKLENGKKDFILDAEKGLDQLFAALNSKKNKLENCRQLINYSREEAELKASLYQEQQLPNVDYLTALLSREKYTLMQEEIFTQIEQIKVKIHTLIGKIKEEK